MYSVHRSGSEGERDRKEEEGWGISEKSVHLKLAPLVMLFSPYLSGYCCISGIYYKGLRLTIPPFPPSLRCVPPSSLYCLPLSP